MLTALQRRRTLLPELNKRNKVGGILDRRIGENDPTMTPEERMLERFTREKTKKKGASLFDLEEAEDEEELTHMGRSLVFGKPDDVDDFDAGSIAMSSDDEDGERKLRKRRHDSVEDDGDVPEVGEGQPERKKSKAEVMKEVIAKSKLHKYERQQQKEEDMDMREDLDKELPDILAALRGGPKPPAPPPVAAPSGADNNFSMNPERAALLNGTANAEPEKEYDTRLRQMALDKRAAPTDRTLTEEERAQKEAERLKELEEKRLRRMRGEEESDAEEDSKTQDEDIIDGDEDLLDDAAEFGFAGASAGKSRRPAGVDDEDDFIIDDDLVASGSDVDLAFSDTDSDDGSEAPSEAPDDDSEFVQGLLTKEEEGNKVFTLATGANAESKVAYTYPCPQTHDELLEVLKDVAESDVVTVIQRIRALYHPQLNADNKAKLAGFSVALVDHISYMTSQKPSSPLPLVEQLIRHIHSLSRTFPDAISKAFRSHLQRAHSSGTLSPGDLVILTAIGTIYPTSDHFHQVVTPAITIMARWMGLTTPQSPQDLAAGAYLGALCLKYQALSKRYIPELLRFTLIALKSPSLTPDLQEAYVNNLAAMADRWHDKSAFIEIFVPKATQVLKSLKQTKALQRLRILLSQARLRRRPLELHHHRPLPLKTSIPKFEESFNPDKHYDPDRERAEASKLRAEYKKERKGALRELRKDANFIAREKLRQKKEADAAYEAKYKRLVAEIQGEEGREKNEYEREKRARKASKKR